MITNESIGLSGRLVAPTDAEVAEVVTGSGAPVNISQVAVQTLNRALERRYSDGYDLSSVGKPEPIEAAYILDNVREILAYWAYWPTQHALCIATLWVAHTWFTDLTGLLLFPATPRFLLVAPKQSGKTRIERLMAALSRNPKGPAVGVVTAPGVRNAMKFHRTLFLDEGHRIFLGRRYDLQGILTGGYTPDSVTLNGQAGEDNDENVFGPVCIGAQPKLMESRFSEDIEDLFDRAFIIALEAAPRQYVPGMDVHPDWVSADGSVRVPPLDEEFVTITGKTAVALSIWAQSETVAGKTLYALHSLNDDLDARAYEISMALCAVADRAVDYRFAEGDPQRIRWSIIAREAICGVKLGTDNTAKMMDEIKEMLARFQER